MVLSLMLAARLLSGILAPIDQEGPLALHRLRGADGLTRTIIEEGCGQSPVFAELVREVEQSNFIVYVEAVGAQRNGSQGALLQTNDAQYLRIYVRRDLLRRDQIAILGHELQHVREMVQADISANAADMEMLFRRIGAKRLARGERREFETTAAKRTEAAVAADLRKSSGTRADAGACRAATQ